MAPKDVRSLIKPGFGLNIVEPPQMDWDAWNGRLLVWEGPQENATYALGVDPAEGVGRDRSVCEVIKVGTLDYPDEQVAEFASDWIDPINFADIINVIGRFYGTTGSEAFCTVEVNSACGDTIVSDLYRRLDYTNQFQWKAYDRFTNVLTNKMGFWTNKTTRPKLIARGLHALMQNDLLVNSRYLVEEMADFKRDHTEAKAKARSGRHDDRVMALLICYFGAHDEEWLNGDDVAEQRRLLRDAKDVQQDLVTTERRPKVPTIQNQAISYAAAMQQWEDRFLEIIGDE